MAATWITHGRPCRGFSTALGSLSRLSFHSVRHSSPAAGSRSPGSWADWSGRSRCRDAHRASTKFREHVCGVAQKTRRISPRRPWSSVAIISSASSSAIGASRRDSGCADRKSMRVCIAHSTAMQDRRLPSRCRQRLRPTHAAKAGGQRSTCRSGRRHKCWRPASDEGFVGTLHDALAADVDP